MARKFNKSAKSAAPRADLYETITSKVLEMLEGGVRPWHQPWKAGIGARPVNHQGKPYNGINILLLWGAADRAGYTNPHWMTFKQAIALGACVRKGEKGSMCVYASTFETKDENDEEKRIPFLKSYTVFNVEQIDGLPDRYFAVAPVAAPLNPHDRIAEADAFFENTGADIRFGGAKAFHSSNADGSMSYVQMPRFENFEDAESYYSTLAHECIHWTRTPKRLNRDFGRKRWGDEGYAMEELVAEMGAAFLCATLGVSPSVREDHAGYLASWIKVLKGDKRAIVTAASHAGKAADFLIGLQPGATADQIDEGEEQRAAA